jgi:hypothetical protein
VLRTVAQVAPEKCGHTALVRRCKRLADLDDLPRTPFGSTIDRSSDCGRSHIEGFLDGAKQDSIELVRICQQLVMPLSANDMLDECLTARTVVIGSRRRSFLTAFGSTSGSV